MDSDDDKRVLELVRVIPEYTEACVMVAQLVGKAEDFLRDMRACTDKGTELKPPPGPTGWPGPEEVSAVLKAWWTAYGRLTNALRSGAPQVISLPKMPR